MVAALLPTPGLDTSVVKILAAGACAEGSGNRCEMVGDGCGIVSSRCVS